MTQSSFTVSAAFSSRVLETRVPIERVAGLLMQASPLTANTDLALIRSLGVRDSVQVASGGPKSDRFAYRVFRVS